MDQTQQTFNIRDRIRDVFGFRWIGEKQRHGKVLQIFDPKVRTEMKPVFFVNWYHVYTNFKYTSVLYSLYNDIDVLSRFGLVG